MAGGRVDRGVERGVEERRGCDRHRRRGDLGDGRFDGLGHGARADRGKDDLAEAGRLLGGELHDLLQPLFHGLGFPAERVGDGLEFAVLHRDSLAGREFLQPLQAGEVGRQVGVVLVAPELGDGVTDGGGCAGREFWGRGPGHELGDVDPARTGEDPEVAVGDRDLATLVRNEFAPAQAGAASHFRQREALLTTNVAQVLAQLLRRDGE